MAFGGICKAAVLAVAALAALIRPAAAGTLDDVQDRGVLMCGVSEESGFAKHDAAGRMRGMRVDICRAIAAAVLEDPEAVTFTPLIATARFQALAAREIDVLIGGTTWTLGREAALGVHFTGPIFYDGQGFIAHADRGWTHLNDVEDATVCVVANTTSIENLEAWADAEGRALQQIELVTSDGAWSTFLGHGCDLMTNDRAGMVMALHDRAPDAADYVVFPDLISREPLSPAVRDDDDRWESIVRFAINALVLAEARGVTQADAAAPDPAAVTDPEARRLLGLDPGIGEALGLDDQWARRAIAAVGNYDEIYQNNLGARSPYRMARGLNALWRDGGLLYPLPIR